MGIYELRINADLQRSCTPALQAGIPKRGSERNHKPVLVGGRLVISLGSSRRAARSAGTPARDAADRTLADVRIRGNPRKSAIRQLTWRQVRVSS